MLGWLVERGIEELKTSGTVHDGTTIKYLAKRSDCAVCPLKRHCTTGLERRISRDVHQDARDYAQALMQTEAYRVSRSARKKIETLFGEAKHNLLAGAPQTARPQRRPGRVLAHRHRPESQTPGSARHKAAATAHDSVANARNPTQPSDRPPTASADRLRRQNTVQPVQSRTQISRPTRLPQQPRLQAGV